MPIPPRPLKEIVLEHLGDNARPETVALASADEASRRALSVLQSTEHLRFVSSEHVRDGAAMVVALGDARAAASRRTLADLAVPHALCVAIVAVDRLRSIAEISEFAGRFDAVLPVAVARDADATAPLARALIAVTAFATADCIALPIGEVNPFFSGARVLTFGDADAEDATTAAAMALAAADFANTARGVRVLLHVETTAQELRRDLEAATSAVARAVRLEDLWVTASVSRGVARKRVSFVAASGRRRTEARNAQS